MDALLLAFITGLTTGGLSCLAVQGGLLASSLANQIEQDLSANAQPPHTRGKPMRGNTTPLKLNTVTPIALFLVAKLVAYTVLGGMLGLLGSFLTFDPITRAVLMIAIGIFMLGNGLRMLNVHPIFRYFAFEPPRFITRHIRKTARDGTNWLTPVSLGALTVFIPCGVTQAMMAVALGTGSVPQGAALMLAFTLGTSPVFFLAAWLTTTLGARLEKFFLRFVAVGLLLLGLVSIDNSLNLLGAPSASGLARQWFAPAAEAASQPASLTADGSVVIEARNNGYYPARVNVPAGQDFTLRMVTNNTTSCVRDFVIPALGFYELLPQTGEVNIPIPAQTAGTVIRYTCSMGMFTGEIHFTGP